MRQLPWAYLQLSKNLNAADPALIANYGSAVLAAATLLEQKSAALSALSANLRQPFSWLSRAATVFIAASSEQAKGVLEVAEPLRALSQALTMLAGELGMAKADASSAVMRSLDLNHEAAELNVRVSAQQAALPVGSASPPGAEEDAAAIMAAQDAASSALSDAEQRAVDAWTHARAAFEFAGNDTSAMVKRWGSAWDPSKHVFLSKAVILACTSLTDFHVPEGGMLTGPDARDYHLVVESGTDVNGNPIVLGRDLPADKEHWHELATRIGTTDFGYEASGWDKIEIMAGGFAGASYTEGSAFDKARLKDIHRLKDGSAWLENPKKMEGGSIKEVTGGPERTGQDELWVAREAGIASGRKAATPDAIGLVDNGLAGMAVALHLNDSRSAGYRVVFEEDDEGNRRARLLLYRVSNSPWEPEAVEVEAGVAGKDGHLQGLATGRDRTVRAEAMPASS